MTRKRRSDDGPHSQESRGDAPRYPPAQHGGHDRSPPPQRYSDAQSSDYPHDRAHHHSRYAAGDVAHSCVGQSRAQGPELHPAVGSHHTDPYDRPVKSHKGASSSSQPQERPAHKRDPEQTMRSEEAPRLELQPLSGKSVRFPLRPGKGTRGALCIVKANHFLAELPDNDLHHYDVSITPEDAPRSVYRDVMKMLVYQYQESDLGRRLPAYDGRRNLYTVGPLPSAFQEFTIALTDKENGPGGARDARVFKLAIRFTARVDLHQLQMFVEGREPNAPQEALQLLDIVLRELPTASYSPVGRSFYSSSIGRKHSLGEGLESWRGFYQSIRPTQMGLSLNIDMSSTAFIEPLPVIEFVGQLLNRDVKSIALSDADCLKIEKALRGVQVEVTHRRKIRPKYRISGLTSQTAREITFSYDEQGTVKTMVDYFQQTHEFIIQHTQLPCLKVGNNERANYLPMEVCNIVKGQRYSRRLNERQITRLLQVTCQRPRDREQGILETVHHNAYGEDRYAKEFGIKITERMAQVEARVLRVPQLKYHELGQEKYCYPQKGKWNMANKRMVQGGRVSHWICINFARNVKDSAARGFCRELAQICNTSGMAFSTEPVLPILSARPEQVERVLRATYCDVMERLRPQRKELNLLIVILPDNNGSLYGELKRICETDLGIVSQCCLQKHVCRVDRQYLANVALKVNVKVGGTSTVLVDATTRRIPIVGEVPTMIFGADVTHPHRGEDSSPSIAAVVGSMDWPNIMKYMGLVSAQARRQELVQDLYSTWEDPVKGTMHGGMIRELLLEFYRSTGGQKPERIIFYRDGVGEGQFYQVLLFELDAMRKACASLEPVGEYQPFVTFVVVQKRHHTRLFPNGQGDGSGNILPGTVVDSGICHPTEFDFYLCSHAGIKGTSRPAHYHVLWDENKFTADDLQMLTNDLCYTYARCTRSVSIVPPAYYAHLAAFRARFYVKPEEASDGGSRRRQNPTSSNSAARPLPQLRENVKKVMFYC